MALEGIAELGQKIDALGDLVNAKTGELGSRQENLQGQINEVRASSARSAPWASLLALTDRVVALETGVAARILAHMENDERERRERQKLVDERHERDRQERAAAERRTTRRVWAIVAVLALIIIALLVLAGVVIWVELRV